MDEDEDNDGRFPDESPVEVRYPRSEQQEEQGDRDQWPWLPGTIAEQCRPGRIVRLRRGANWPSCATASGHRAARPAVTSTTCCYRDRPEIRPRTTPSSAASARGAGRPGDRRPGNPLHDGGCGLRRGRPRGRICTPFGIDVVVIEPGGITTEWGDIAAGHLREVSDSGPYARQANAMARSLGAEPGGRRGSPPSVIGDTIATAVTARRPKTRYPAGFGVRPALLLQRLLPDRAFDAFIRRASGIPA